METCERGLPNVAWQITSKYGLRLFEGHGVGLVGDANDFDAERMLKGSPHVDSMTLVDGPGGVEIALCDVVLHTPRLCKQGLYEASR